MRMNRNVFVDDCEDQFEDKVGANTGGYGNTGDEVNDTDGGQCGGNVNQKGNADILTFVVFVRI